MSHTLAGVCYGTKASAACRSLLHIPLLAPIIPLLAGGEIRGPAAAAVGADNHFLFSFPPDQLVENISSTGNIMLAFNSCTGNIYSLVASCALSSSLTSRLKLRHRLPERS